MAFRDRSHLVVAKGRQLADLAINSKPGHVARQSMKLISILLLLLSSAVAQDQPFAFSQVADTWQGRNVAPKEILAYVVEFKSPYAIFAHDYYFKPEGIAPGAVATFDLKASKPGHVLWAQFVDGTEWGNHNVGLSNLLRLRPGLLRWLSEMINA